MTTPIAPPTSSVDRKVDLATGSSRGIGRYCVPELASRSASVAINCSRAAESVESIIKEIETLGQKAIAIKADVSKPAETAAMFEKAVEHYSHLDIVAVLLLVSRDLFVASLSE